jgi:hypothetical protein
LKLTDLHYRILKSGSIGPYGYILEYALAPEHFPKPGRNRVGVLLVKRDPKMKPPIGVYDVDCAIEYRLHRHFEKTPIEY